MASISHYYIFVLYLLVLSCFYQTILVEGKLRTFELNISKSPLILDCNDQRNNSRKEMLINGQYPGPAIQATLNDDIEVLVRNRGDEPTTIHFHGILQINTVESDGVPNITQYEIAPGGEFKHQFRLVRQTGTFFYHAHLGLQDDGIQGPFIIYPTEAAWPVNVNGAASGAQTATKQLVDGPHTYNDERILQLSEWWAQDPDSRLDYYMGPKYQGIIPADRYLMNGRFGGPGGGIACPGMAALDVTQGQVYRLRVIGAMSVATLGFSIAKHKMTIIETDGHLVQPYDVSYLEVSPGQRYSVLLKANEQPGTSYNMDVRPYWMPNVTATGRAILNYLGGAKEKPTRSDLAKYSPKEFTLTTLSPATDPTVPTFPQANSQFVFPSLVPVEKSTLNFNAEPNRTIILFPVEQIVQENGKNVARFSINGHRLNTNRMPMVYQLKQARQSQPGSSFGMNATAMALNKRGTGDGYDENFQTYPILLNEVVDFVIHTTTIPDSNTCSGGHPWHSHGVVHYPIAHGVGQYNHQTQKDLRTYRTPVARDATLIYPTQPQSTEKKGGIPCGWTKLRIYADNPGLWAFHCHITAHMAQGMMTVMEIASDQIKYR